MVAANQAPMWLRCVGGSGGDAWGTASSSSGLRWAQDHRSEKKLRQAVVLETVQGLL